ncbi:MAG: response regulator [Verrucomicrobiota bacterium]|nr:response regulator [Verrucomicrobiota bacterium]
MNVRNILVAEDNPDDALIFKMMFRRSGVSHQMHMVDDGEQVIAWLEGRDGFMDRQKYPLPDLLILDLKMPIKGGFEVLDWLRGQEGFGKVPSLILSSSDDPKDVKKASELCVTGYFIKSPDLHDVMDYLRKWA